MMGSLMKDPQMQEIMRQQQATLVKQMYSDFVKSAGLSREQADRFYALLLDDQMGDLEQGLNFLEGNEAEAAVRDGGAVAANARTNVEQELEALLGPGGFASYNEYRGSIGERTALNEVRDQMAVDSTPLADHQAKALLQVMIEERSRSGPAVFDPNSGSFRQQMQAISDGSNTDAFYNSQAEFNGRVATRAVGILQPDQLRALETYQKQQLEMQKFGMEMARRMFDVQDDASVTTTIVTPRRGR
jgi:hypothetical protein